MTKEWSLALTPQITHDGSKYTARALGFQRDDGMWEGRVEFHNGAGAPVSTGHETTQPNLTDLQYWANGLEKIFLEGALQRALRNKRA
jgi:hypothetical protein